MPNESDVPGRLQREFHGGVRHNTSLGIAAPAAASWRYASSDALTEEKRLVGPQQYVAVDDDPHRQARSSRERRLDVYVAPGHFLAHLIEPVLGTVVPGDRDAISVLRFSGAANSAPTPSRVVSAAPVRMHPHCQFTLSSSPT